MIKILKPDEYLEHFHKVGNLALKAKLVPEVLSNLSDVTLNAELLRIQSEGCIVYYIEDDVNPDVCAYSVVFEDHWNPHVMGIGYPLINTLSSGSKEICNTLLRRIKKDAELAGMQWIYISHRIKEFEYRGKYYLLKG